MARKQSKKRVKVRNQAARNPLMRKGGAHGRTRKAQRRADKIAITQERPGDER